MSVFRINKNDNYTVMSNYHLKDKNLTYKAKGLLSFMLSLLDDCDYSMNSLVAISKKNNKLFQYKKNKIVFFTFPFCYLQKQNVSIILFSIFI